MSALTRSPSFTMGAHTSGDDLWRGATEVGCGTRSGTLIRIDETGTPSTLLLIVREDDCGTVQRRTADFGVSGTQSGGEAVASHTQRRHPENPVAHGEHSTHGDGVLKCNIQLSGCSIAGELQVATGVDAC